jgi:iron complex transport system ATP-binding protein
MQACDIIQLAHRKANTLSGGELARVHCARAFAAETPLLIADEPVAALDPHHQFGIMELFKTYVAKGGGALVVLHDIGLAAKYRNPPR